jgi:hypothetical protein
MYRADAMPTARPASAPKSTMEKTSAVTRRAISAAGARISRPRPVRTPFAGLPNQLRKKFQKVSPNKSGGESLR